jgi:uncharacterized membrane protein
MIAPAWALALTYWLHMLATVLWIGALAVLAILVLPTAQRLLPPAEVPIFLEGLQKRLDPLAWFCLVLLIGTGMIQMSSNPNYAGFMAFENQWAVAILLKHILFLGMIGLSAYQTWGVMPAFRRAALRKVRNPESSEVDYLTRREIWLVRGNLALGVVVLLFTALARAA